MIMNLKNYDNEIAKVTSDISTANGRITKNASDITTANGLISKNTTDIATANGRITKNATDITTANGRITQNTSAIGTTNNNLATLRTEFNAVSDLAYNHLCYVSVLSIAQSANYVFASPFLRAVFIGQINNFVHVIHVSREGVYAAAEGFRTENMSLMSVATNGNAMTITNLNAENVLRVFVLFK